MAISTDIAYARVDDLFLDPFNPRLGRNNTGEGVTQETILELMSDWSLEELAISYLEGGGFWTHEALLVIYEKLYGTKKMVVIEGNRRLAALKILQKAFNGEFLSSKWKEIVTLKKPSTSLFTKVPYVLVDSRKDIEAFLGFRHVTGIKEWKPAEKAEYIAKLVDESKMSYEEVMRKIGSKTQTVRQNYISYRLLLQMEDSVPNFPIQKVEERFSVMYLSLRTEGVRKFLDIDIQASPQKAKKPVPQKHLQNLKDFAFWLFGTDEKPSVISDSRQVDNFGKILASNKATEYLRRSDSPNFDVALRISGGDEEEILEHIEKAADNVELALTRVHTFKKSKRIQSAVKRVGEDSLQLLEIFPEIKSDLLETNKD